MKATVSVVMATYNGAKYIREQLDSILAQTYPVAEIIIQDDGSTDDTVAICRDYAARYPVVQVYQNTENLGYKKNFETVARRAHGDFVALSDQDDVWFPNKIELQLNQIGQNDLCYSHNVRGAEQGSARLVRYRANLLNHLFYYPLGHTLLMRRAFAQNPSNWLDYCYYDWGLAIRAELQNGCTMVEQPLVWHREHAASATNMKGEEDVRMFGRPDASKIAPYLHGFKRFRQLQQNPNFRAFYTHVYEHTADARYATAHRICKLLLSPGLLSWIALSIVCMAQRKQIYPEPQKMSGLMGMVRGLFFPSIYFYHCRNF